MEAHVANAMRGELLRNGISIALLGAPNAGKSSLLNRIVGRDAAIVSHEAGTTRDVVEVGIDLGGWLVKIGDMAGLRRAGLVGAEAVGAVEQEGIKRAKQRALNSDVLIVVQDATTETDPEVMETAKQCADLDIRVIVAFNKIDQLDQLETTRSTLTMQMQSALGIPADRVVFISCKAPTTTASSDPGHIQAFITTLLDTFKDMTAALVPDSDPDPGVWQESLGATERQRVLLSECLGHLETFLTAVSPHALVTDAAPSGMDDEVDIVVAAESLRSAAESLARITGRGDSGDVEEVLGVVFEK
jgi:tRNA modification GTPase